MPTSEAGRAEGYSFSVTSPLSLSMPLQRIAGAIASRPNEAPSPIVLSIQPSPHLPPRSISLPVPHTPTDPLYRPPSLRHNNYYKYLLLRPGLDQVTTNAVLLEASGTDTFVVALRGVVGWFFNLTHGDTPSQGVVRVVIKGWVLRLSNKGSLITFDIKGDGKGGWSSPGPLILLKCGRAAWRDAARG
eukprot:762923-Hanusia_phi.AAC.3